MNSKYLILNILLSLILANVKCEESPGDLEGRDQDEVMDSLGLDKVDVSENDDAKIEEENAAYIEKKSKSKYMIVQLKKANNIIDDISHGMKVVLLVQNNPKELQNKEEGAGLYQKIMIEKLKISRDVEEISKIAFYFTTCEFLDNLCHEMMVNTEINQVVYVSKFITYTVPMSQHDLSTRVWEIIMRNVVTYSDIDALNEMVESKGGANVILFNGDTEEEASRLQRQRRKELVDKCKSDCFEKVEFATIENRDEFLKREENLGKTFLIRKGKFLETPFELRGSGSSKLGETIKMVNNEGLDDYIHNNNLNYFNVYQNDNKAMVVLVLNTEDKTRKEAILEIYKQAALIHREHRTDFTDRYTFVVSDLKEGESQYSSMMLEVIGDIDTEAEVFIFSRGNHMDNYENFKMKQNTKDIDAFLKDLEGKIKKFEEVLQKKKDLEIEVIDPEESKFNEDEKDIDVYGEIYKKDWEKLITLRDSDQSDLNEISVKSILGFLSANDMDILGKNFYKSEEEDKAHNDSNIKTGILQVTGENFDRLVFDLNIDHEEFPEVRHNFILIVCRHTTVQDQEDCLRVGTMLNYIREEYHLKESETRIGIMDHIKNDHPIVEKFDIEHFPVLIFFGRKDKKKRGKIFRGKLVVEKVIKWLNKKFIVNEGAGLKLNDDHYKNLLLLSAKSDE